VAVHRNGIAGREVRGAEDQPLRTGGNRVDLDEEGRCPTRGLQ
jgi:hypothetical protein